MRIPLAILSLLCIAATAAAQVPTAASVKDSVDALSLAGPWLGLLLVAIGYLDLRVRERKCGEATRASEAKWEAEVAALNQRIDELQEKRFAEGERDTAAMRVLADRLGGIVEANTLAIDRAREFMREHSRG